MKKLNPWLFLSLFVAAFTLSACGDDKDDNPPKDEKIEVTEANLKGTWDGSVERDFAQGYYQRWRVQFDGKNYTAWHTHQIVGTINDQDMSLKTVGNKEQGTWEYKDDALILTPKKMWASYYLTAKTINDPYYTVYLDYNPETMECTEWYETPEATVKSGVEREQNSGGGALFYLKKWPVAGFTKTELTVKVNMDVFKLNKK
jgi:hypothetical protein